MGKEEIARSEKWYIRYRVTLSQFCSLGTTSVLAPNLWTNVSWESNSRPYDCETDGLPYDHGHHGYWARMSNPLRKGVTLLNYTGQGTVTGESLS